MELDAQIEAILFFKAEPQKVWDLARLLRVKPEEIDAALVTLEEKLRGRGLTLVRREDEVMLGTSAALSGMLENIRRDELSKELSRASLETLSIIVYKNGSTRAEIDYIRGVNSSFILRALMVRGLVEKVPHPTDSRKFLYKPTLDLLSFMGLSRIEDIPEYSSYHELLSQKLTIASDASESEEKGE